MPVKLSFILPCYNVGRFITDTLGSLYAQGMTEDEFEVICVNDCSTDDTHDRIAAFAEAHPNLFLLDQPWNMYSGAARNRGLDVAQGEYIWFVDSDDQVNPGVAPKLLELACAEKLDLLLFNYDEFVDGHPEDVHPVQAIFPGTDIMDGGSFVHTYFDDRLTRLSLLWLRLFRRGLIEENKIRFPDLYISQDCPFAWETLLLAKRVKAIPDRCYLYRSSAGSITANKNTAKKAAVWSFQFPYELERVSEEECGEQGSRRDCPGNRPEYPLRSERIRQAVSLAAREREAGLFQGDAGRQAVVPPFQVPPHPEESADLSLRPARREVLCADGEAVDEMKMMNQAQIIQLPKNGDRRGNLSVIEQWDRIPFKIERAFWIYDVPGGAARGGHAYRESEEFIVALSGSFDVVIDDGKEKRVFSLNRSYYGLYVPKMMWREMVNFSTNSVALVLSSTPYDAADYIRDYEEFKQVKR